MTRLDIRNLEGVPDDGPAYYLFVSALGYEKRATAIADYWSQRSLKRMALGFDHNHVLSFERNKAWFSDHGFDLKPNLSPAQFEALFRDVIFADARLRESAPVRIGVDVSCFDRFRLAVIVDAIWALARECDLAVDFHYSIAQFRAPSPVRGRNEVAGPVHRRFAGRFVDPGRPLALVAGLGYELGKVMGAAEYLQASRVIALFP